MAENGNFDILHPLDIKQEAIDIYEEFADNELVLQAMREGNTTIKLEDIIANLPINEVVQEDVNVFSMKLRSKTLTKNIAEISNGSEPKEIKKLNNISDDDKKSNLNTKHTTILSNNIDTIDETGMNKKIMKRSYYNAKDKYKCDLCLFVCQYAKKLFRHKRSKHKRYQCDSCPYQTSSIVLFEPHLFRHRFVRPYVCDICSMDFKNKGKITRHMHSHEQIRKYKCANCPLAFVEKCNLNSHLKVHFEIFPYKCRFCSFKSKYKSSLKDHLRSHAGLRLFSCDLCSFKAVTKSALNSHKFTHTDERPYSCSECLYKAKIKWKLIRHIVSVHTTKILLECQHCSYTTYYQDKFDIHNETHQNDSFYPCIICFLIFKKKSTLDKHLERHKLLKDLKCTKCSMRECCEKHKYFDSNFYDCNFCSKRFYKRRAIEIHMTQYHET